MEHTYQLKNMYDCAPFMFGGRMSASEIVELVSGVTVSRAGMSCSTSSQMWSSWYLPKFLLKVGH